MVLSGIWSAQRCSLPQDSSMPFCWPGHSHLRIGIPTSPITCDCDQMYSLSYILAGLFYLLHRNINWLHDSVGWSWNSLKWWSLSNYPTSNFSSWYILRLMKRNAHTEVLTILFFKRNTICNKFWSTLRLRGWRVEALDNVAPTLKRIFMWRWYILPAPVSSLSPEIRLFLWSHTLRLILIPLSNTSCWWETSPQPHWPSRKLQEEPVCWIWYRGLGIPAYLGAKSLRLSRYSPWKNIFCVERNKMFCLTPVF